MATNPESVVILIEFAGETRTGFRFAGEEQSPAKIRRTLEQRQLTVPGSETLREAYDLLLKKARGLVDGTERIKKDAYLMVNDDSSVAVTTKVYDVEPKTERDLRSQFTAICNEFFRKLESGQTLEMVLASEKLEAQLRRSVSSSLHR